MFTGGIGMMRGDVSGGELGFGGPGDDYYHCERRFGSFRRTVELPESADPDDIHAEMKNGVLTVRVGKTAAAKSEPRRIEVQGAEKVSMAGTPV